MGLFVIKETVQAVADAISAAIGIETEIIDSDQIIVAGTGRYRDRVGSIEVCGDDTTNEIYGTIFRTGKEYVVEDALSDDNYWGEENELAEVCCPIISRDQVIGIIGLVAFNQEQKQLILNNSKNLLDFCRKMAYLIATKVQEVEISDGVKTILQSINTGILALDKRGFVFECNSTALYLLGLSRDEVVGQKIDSFWNRDIIKQSLKKGWRVDNTEISYGDNPDGTKRFFVSISPILHKPSKIASDQENHMGLVITINDMVDIHKMVYDMTENNPDITYDDIVGRSDAIRTIKDYIKRISNSVSTILITGESGTGKGLIAKTIHKTGDRRDKPFITINCGALPDNLIESELFGFEEGSFTGARKNGKPGKFELAEGGTVFLDEIGDLPLHLQVKLLHVLQAGKFERIGGTKEITVNVRIIAATNRNLEDMILNNEFREDLYFRLNVIPIHIPPLRDRRVDILPLISNALKKYNMLLGKEIKGFTNESIDFLLNYDWPGNIRELENVIEYAINMEDGDIIEINNLPHKILNKHELPKGQTLDMQLEVYEKQIITNCLEQCGYSVTGKKEAAEILGIGEATLYRKIKKLNIKQ
jgi:PAS domain S-box-containing protein